MNMKSTAYFTSSRAIELGDKLTENYNKFSRPCNV